MRWFLNRSNYVRIKISKKYGILKVLSIQDYLSIDSDSIAFFVLKPRNGASNKLEGERS